MGPELQNARWMYFKAVCFALVVLFSAAGLLLPMYSWRGLLLVCLLVWASARFYYFCFYVIERYIDPSFRFSGMGSVVGYLVRGASGRVDREIPDRRE